MRKALNRRDAEDAEIRREWDTTKQGENLTLSQADATLPTVR